MKRQYLNKLAVKQKVQFVAGQQIQAEIYVLVARDQLHKHYR